MRIFLLLLVLAGYQANALVEVRGHYGNLAQPSGFNKDMDAANPGWPALPAPSVFGADVLFSLPLLPTFGLRYEQYTAKSGSGTITGGTMNGATINSTTFSGTRISLLGGYRFIDTLVYLGPLVHFAVSQSAKYKLQGTGFSADVSGTMESSYGGGLEAGVHAAGLLLGAEAGYTSLKAKSSSSSGTTVSALDLSGTYFKVMLGLAF